MSLRSVLSEETAHEITEGSGLGLSIAESLMKLMNGTLELTVDGDLFKVTLEF